MEFKLSVDTLSEPLIIELEDTDNAECFLNFLRQCNKPADQVTSYGFYNYDQLYEKFTKLGILSNSRFNLNWNLADTSQTNFNNMHKDLETFDEMLHQPWTTDDDDLLIEVHSSMHEVEKCLSSNVGNNTFIRFKWWNNSIPWPSKPKFIPYSEITYGDVFVDYPYVGKSPFICMVNKDNSILAQTCKLPDACPSGFDISFNKHKVGDTSAALARKLTVWYNENIDQLGTMFSLEKMLSYVGEYRIGRIKNVELLDQIEQNLPTSASIID